MALLDSFYGDTPSYLGGLLGEDELRRLQGQAQSQSNLGMATALLRAGAPSRTPGGGALAIAEGLQMGQDTYRKALNQGLQEKMQGLQVQDMLLKRQEQVKMHELFPQIFKMESTPDQQFQVSPEQLMMYGQPTQGVVRDNEGNMMPGGSIVPAQMQTIPGTRTMSVDTNKLQALAAMSSDPLAAYANLAKLVPDLRKAGFIGGQQGENPFSIFVNDPTIPANFRNAAAQYQKSYASGQLDPEKADERVRQLAQSIQSTQDRAATETRMNQQFEQSQAGLNQNRQQMQLLAQQNADTRAAAEANKPEQFSYAQKKEFDIVQKNLAAAKDAEDSAAIANRAAPLLPQAFGSKTEALFKGALNAVTPMTFTAKDANDQLVQYGQQLALKTPKFSGPTSDADAKRYDTAVGDISNPSKSLESKTKALKDIKDLAQKSQDYAQQQENYFYQNKSLRGFKYVPSENPFGR